MVLPVRYYCMAALWYWPKSIHYTISTPIPLFKFSVDAASLNSSIDAYQVSVW